MYVRYTRIKKEEGVKCFPHIGSIFVSDDKDLWANPFENTELRHRCFFEIKDSRTMEIFFHLTQNECNNKTSITTFPCKTYFSGAYNQINVCQMRAFGELILITEPADIEAFREKLTIDLKNRTNDTNVSSMNEVTTEEKLKALEITSKDDGMFFKFIPKSYASHMYERG
jgi:hypothetical protein